jgi:hypothetical protein
MRRGLAQSSFRANLTRDRIPPEGRPNLANRLRFLITIGGPNRAISAANGPPASESFTGIIFAEPGKRPSDSSGLMRQVSDGYFA